jgi:hypothetical protein
VESEVLCPQGHLNIQQARFCRTCGEALGGAESAAPTQVVPPSITTAPAPTEALHIPTGKIAVPPATPLPPPPVAGAAAAAGAAAGMTEGRTYGAPTGETPAVVGGPAAIPYPVMARPAKSRTGLVVALIIAGVLVLALGGTVAALALTKHTSSAAATFSHTPSSPVTAPPPTTPAMTTPTTSPLAASEAQALAAMLSTSSADRSSIVSATAQITSCGDLYDAEQTLDQAASSRQQLISQLGTTTLSALPNSVQLVQALNAAWQASLSSDNSYAAYAGDELENSGGCVPNDPNDPNAQAAGQSDAAATTAKTQFVQLWSPIAQTFGLQQYSASDV